MDQPLEANVPGDGATLKLRGIIDLKVFINGKSYPASFAVDENSVRKCFWGETGSTGIKWYMTTLITASLLEHRKGNKFSQPRDRQSQRGNHRRRLGGTVSRLHGRSRRQFYEVSAKAQTNLSSRGSTSSSTNLNTQLSPPLTEGNINFV